MRSSVRGLVCVAAAAMLSGTPAPAHPCGDKLAPLGGGVGFDRVVASRHPGRIALLLEPASALAAANAKLDLAATLSLAGHDVAVAEDMPGLERILVAAPTDLVLVDASHAGKLHLTATSSGKQGPTIIPVLFAPGTADAAMLKQQLGCVADASDRDGRRLMQAIEKTLRLRQRGQPLPCEGRSSQQNV